LKRSAIGFGLILLLLTSGCFQWTEDQNGHLTSAGLPGVPVWQSKEPPPALTPLDAGFTPEEAAKIGGPALVEPSTTHAWRYRFYHADNNKCADDLNKLMAERARENSTDPAAYCTDHPTEPPTKGHALLF
jgi:hypothetical protein